MVEEIFLIREIYCSFVPILHMWSKHVFIYLVGMSHRAVVLFHVTHVLLYHLADSAED